MDQTGLKIYLKNLLLRPRSKTNRFHFTHTEFPLVGYTITGQGHTFVTLKSENVISLFQ